MRLNFKYHIAFALLVGLVAAAGITYYQFLIFTNLPHFSEESYSYGFPFAVYEYHVMFSRGKIQWHGIAGNLFLIVAVGSLMGFVVSRLRNSNNLK